MYFWKNVPDAACRIKPRPPEACVFVTWWFGSEKYSICLSLFLGTEKHQCFLWYMTGVSKLSNNNNLTLVKTALLIQI